MSAILVMMGVASVTNAADLVQPLTPIDTKTKGITTVMPKEDNVLTPTEITSETELAKSPLFDKDSAEKLKKEVSFQKEKLVVFAWSGSVGDTFTANEQLVLKEFMLATFRYTRGTAVDQRKHFQIFVLPKNASIFVDAPLRRPNELTPIDTKAKGITVVVPKEGSALDPTEIKTAEELVQSSLFENDSANKLKKEVNFQKEKLIVFAWKGTEQDSIYGELNRQNENAIAKFYFSSRAEYLDRVIPRPSRSYFQLFVVPQNSCIFIRADNTGASNVTGVKNISTERLTIAFLEDPAGSARPQIIASPTELARSPILKDAADEILKQVDFDKQKLVLLVWAGSSQDRLWIDGKFADKKIVLAFQVDRGNFADCYKHMRLFAVPKELGVEPAASK